MYEAGVLLKRWGDITGDQHKVVGLMNASFLR